MENFDPKELAKKEIEEIKRTGKYPKRFLCLPPYFCRIKKDNDYLNESNPFENNNVLKIKKEFLGINKTHDKITHEIDFGVLYILNALGTELYKIGITKNFERRFRDLANASPIPLVVVKYALCDNPHLVEINLQNKFKKQLFKNEWFELSYDDFKYCSDFINRYYNIDEV